MARSKPDEDRKTRTIQIRVTDDQYTLLSVAAGSAHLELSTWIRYVALRDAEDRFDVAKVIAEGPARRGRRPAKGGRK